MRAIVQKVGDGEGQISGDELLSLFTRRPSCPRTINSPLHYREDGSCKCKDPNDPYMPKWGYIWSERYQKWVWQ